MTFLQLFQLISWYHIKHNKMRTFFVLMVVAIGTMIIYSAINSVYNSTLARNHTTNLLTGSTTLILQAGENLIEPSMIDTLKAIDGVEAVVPLASDAGLVIGSVNILALWGIDPAIEPTVRNYQLEAGSFISEQGSVLVTESYAERTAVQVGETIRLSGRRGIRTYTIAGIVAQTGIASLNGGDLMIMHYADVQDIRGNDRFNSLGLVVTQDRIEAVEASIVIPEGTTLENLADQSEKTTIEYVTEALQMISSAVPAILGSLLIGNTISAGIAQRRKEVAILRAIGLRGFEVRNLLLLEAFLIGIIGASLGVLLSFLVVGNTYSATINGFSSQVSGNTSPLVAIIGISIGILITMGATWFPAQRTLEVDPTEAMRAPVMDTEMMRFSRLRFIAGVVILIATGSFSIAVDNTPLVPLAVVTGFLGTLIGMVMIFPPIMVWVIERVPATMTRLFGFSGLLASENLAKRQRRAISTGLIVILVVWFWGVATPLSEGKANFTEQYLKHEFSWDLIVSGAGMNAANPLSIVPEDVVSQLETSEVVETVVRERQIPLEYQGGNYTLRAVDVANFYAGGGRFFWEIGDDTVYARLQDTTRPAILTSGLPALMAGLRIVGSTVTLQTPSGAVEFEVVGTVSSPSDGVFVIDRTLYQQLWGDDSISRVNVNLLPNVDIAETRRQLQTRFGLEGIYIVDRAELLAILAPSSAMDISLAIFLLPFMILGIANMFFISILDRRREFGMLRAIGSLQGQLSQSVMTEAFIITTIASIVSIPISFFTLDAILIDRITGVAMIFNVSGVIRVAILIVIFGMLAAYLPARRAGRTNILEALRYE